MIGGLGLVRTWRLRLSGSPLAARFAGAAAWSVFGAVLTSGIVLVTMVLVARLLERTDYGQFVLLQSTLLSASLLAGLGMNTVAVRYTAELRVRDPARLGRVLSLGEYGSLLGAGLATLGLCVFAREFAVHVLSSAELARPVLVAAPAVFFLVFDAYQKSVLIGLEAMRTVTLTTLAGVLFGLPTMLWLAHAHGLEGAATAMTLTAFAQAAIGRFALRRERLRRGIAGGGKGWWAERSLIWNYALPGLIVGGLVGPAHWLVQTILASRPDGFAQVAVLGIAMQWFNVIMFIPTNAGKVVLPILTDRLVGQDRHGSRSILLYAMAANGIVALPLAMLLWMAAPIFLGFYGPSYAAETTPFILAVLTAALLAVIGPIGAMMAAASRMWLAAATNAGWALVYVGLVQFRLGDTALGVVVALACAYVVHSIWTIAFARAQLRRLAPPSASS